MRAFIFSMDGFVAFTLALVAVYSLVFFSSVPSGYYATLAQAHTLAGDTLEALDLTRCVPDVPGCPANEGNASVLEYISIRSDDPDAIRSFIDPQIPPAFGYRLESKQAGGGWDTLYDSVGQPGRPPGVRKLSVSSFRLLFQYDSALPSPENPYGYLTCTGSANVCAVPRSTYDVPRGGTTLVKLIIYT